MPSEPPEKGQAYLCWLCIRMLVIFALALLPLIAIAVALLMGLREKPGTAGSPEPAEVAQADTRANEAK